jgi:uncharacterized protein
MSRPQGGQSGGSAANSTSNGNRIDASICARSGSTIERHFAAAELPRLREAGAGDKTEVTTRLRFSQFDGRVVIEGELEGVLMLECQRCMKPFAFELHEPFKVMLVEDEEELEREPGGYEAILGNPAHFDLLGFAEDQALLALPLVPKHQSESCAEIALAAEPDALEAEQGTQRPFGNLRDLMRGRDEK